MIAVGLTIAAASGGHVVRAAAAGRPVRIVVAAVVLVLSLPWIAAELGFYLPGDVFMGDEADP